MAFKVVKVPLALKALMVFREQLVVKERQDFKVQLVLRVP